MMRKRSPHPSGRMSMLFVVAAAALGCRSSADDIRAEAREQEAPSAVGQSTGEERPRVPSLVAPAPLPAPPETDEPAKAEPAKAEPAKPPTEVKAEPKRATEAHGKLSVKRFVIASGVAKREPVGAAKRFRASEVERLYGFVELTNETREASAVTVTFSPPAGGAAVRVRLDVGAERRFRTWATTRKLKTPGTWSATVTTEDGRVLARTTFEIER